MTAVDTRLGGHMPVMLTEVIASLSPGDGELFVDGTFGGGGYARAILAAADCRLIALDRDPAAAARAAGLADAMGERFRFLDGCFGDMEALLSVIGVGAVDGIVLDLGVSGFQLEEGERGFSFQADGPLDMRMSGSGESAADIVNGRSEQELADIFYRYGEERDSRRIAAAIVHDRALEPFTTTRQLASLLERLERRRWRRSRQAGRLHPATRVFQALRIVVNDELGELSRGLEAAERLLCSGGRLVVVSFHSLEDRLVKRFLAAKGDGSGNGSGSSRHRPAVLGGGQGVVPEVPVFQPLYRAVQRPGPAACKGNPRARSARLRAAIRTPVPTRQGRLGKSPIETTRVPKTTGVPNRGNQPRVLL